MNPPEPSTMAFLSKTFREGCSSVVCPAYLGPWVLVPLTHTHTQKKTLLYTKVRVHLGSSENPEKQRKSPIIPPPDDRVCGHSDIIPSRWLFLLCISNMAEVILQVSSLILLSKTTFSIWGRRGWNTGLAREGPGFHSQHCKCAVAMTALFIVQLIQVHLQNAEL